MGLYRTGPLPLVALRKYSAIPAPTGGRAPVPGEVAEGAALAADVAVLGAALLRRPMARVISGPVNGPRRYDSAQRVFMSTGASSCTFRIRNTRCVRLDISDSRFVS